MSLGHRRFTRLLILASLLALPMCSDPSRPTAADQLGSTWWPVARPSATAALTKEARAVLKPRQQKALESAETAREAAVRAYRSEPSMASRLALARTAFPTVAGTSALTAERGLVVELPTDAAGTLALTSRGYTFHVRDASGPTVPALRDASAAFIDERHFFLPATHAANEGGRWTTTRLEELWVLDTATGAHRSQYEVTLPAGITAIHDAGDAVEFLDAQQHPVLRFHATVVRDAAGHFRTGDVALRGVEPLANGLFRPRGASVLLTTHVSLEGLTAPLVVDPGWSPATAMATPRANHNTVRLSDGRVMAIGGYNSAAALASAEIFDPVTGVWSAASSMRLARVGATATVLGDGRVMVVGGFNATGAANTKAELYDPVEDVWLDGGTTQARAYHTATLLKSGQILLAGGVSSLTGGTPQYVHAFELYDPTTGWKVLPAAMQDARYSHTATLLQDGTVLLAGGFDEAAVGTLTEIFSLSALASTTTGSLQAARESHSATLLQDGRVFAAGGFDPTSTTALNSTEFFDPSTGTWSPAASLANARAEHVGALLTNGKLLLLGGETNDPATPGAFLAVGAAEVYDPTADAWTGAGTLATARSGATATLLANGQVFVVGGSDAVNPPAIVQPESYDPGLGAWNAASSLAQVRTGHTATLLATGQILVTGGDDGSTALNSSELYDPAGNSWSGTAALTTARTGQTATLLADGRVLVVGGNDRAAALDAPELYSPSTGIWSAAAGSTTPRTGHTATLLLNGKVLVVGGFSDLATTVQNSAQLYDPSADSWAPAAPLNTARANHTANLLPNGQVVVVGGTDGSNPLASMELYDPTANTWTPIVAPSGNLVGHTTTVLTDGSTAFVLTVGGFDGMNPLATFSKYDGTFTQPVVNGALDAARQHHTATLLPNGKILLAGGTNGSGQLASSSVYTPDHGAWSAVGTLGTARTGHTATLLADGRVLVVGGTGTSGVIGSAEIYDDTAASSAARPQLVSTSALSIGGHFTAQGTLFRGLSSSSIGGFQDSPSDAPLVVLQPLDGSLLYRATLSAFSDTSLAGQYSTLPPRPYFFSIQTSGVLGGSIVQVAPNTAPTANNASATTLENQAVTFKVTGADINLDPFAFRIASQPANGVASLAGPGKLTYTPNANFNGADTFTFTAWDGMDTGAPATATITVTPVNQPPTIAAVSNQTVLENAGAQTVSLTGLAAGPANESSQGLTITTTSDTPSVIPNPTVNYTGGSTATLSYTPVTNAAGSATITLTMKDDGGTANGGVDTTVLTFTISVTPVNQAPTLAAISNVTVLENGTPSAVTLTGITAGPANESSQLITVSATSDNTALVPNPSVSAVSGGQATLTYSLVANANGTAHITVKAQDNGGTANGGVDTVTQTFTVTVTPVNQPPTIAAVSNVSVLENAGTQTVTLTGLSTGPANEASQTLTITATSDTPAVIPNPSVNYTGGSTASLSFTPVTNANGVAHITVKVQDNGGTANGGVDTVTTSFTISVTAVNQAPTLAAISNVTILENGTPSAVTLTGITAGPANESSQLVTVSATSDNTALVPNPSVSAVSGGQAALTYSLVANANGTAHITVKAQDNGGTANGGVDTVTQTFTITVTAVNQPPTIAAASNQAYLESATTHTATVTLTGITAGPANESSQTVSVAASSSNTALISNVSTTPVSGGQSTLSFNIAGNLNGSSTITVTVQDNGGTANGGVDTTTITFLVTVGAVNQPPTLASISNVTVLENGTPAAITLTGITAGPANESSQLVTVSASSDNTALVPNPSVSTVSGGQATLTYSLVANANGTAHITVKAQDNGGTANGGVDTVTQSFTITVTAVNQPPTFTAVGAQTVFETTAGTTLTIPLTGLAAGPANESTQALTATATSDNPGLVATPLVSSISGGAATLTAVVQPQSFGSATITVTLKDNGGTANGGVDTTVFTIPVTVTYVNQAPTLGAIADVGSYENAPPQNVLLTGITSGAVTEASQSLSVTATSDNPALIPDPVVSAVTGFGQAALTFQPVANSSGTATITVTVQDSGGTANGGVDTTSQTFTITVVPVNVAPTIDPVADVTLNQDGSATVTLTNVTAGRPSEASQQLTITAASDNPTVLPAPTVSPLSGSTATLTLKPAQYAFGSANITLTLKDNGGTANGGQDTTVLSFAVTVQPVNHAPTVAQPADVTMQENGQPLQVTLTGITPGSPPNEAAQSVFVTATASDPGLIPSIAVTPVAGGKATLTLTAGTNLFGTATITVTVHDNGGTANGGVDTTTVTFKVTVLLFNHPPTFDALPSVTIHENSGQQTVNIFNITPGPASEAGQHVTLTATSSNPSLIPTPTISAITGGAATLTFTPVPMQSGSATVTVTAKDDGGTANGGSDTSTRSFSVTVIFVNQAPTMDSIADVSVLEDSGAMSVQLTGIAPGPASEASQSVVVSAVSSNPGLIPGLIASGVANGTAKLTLAPAAGRYGTATITVKVQDNGGTLNGGTDTLTRTFQVNVQFVNHAPTLAPIADVQMLENASPRTVVLTGITSGPASESSQHMTLTATSADPTVADVSVESPISTGAALLRVTPSGAGGGTTTITVTIQDDGGTANGGQDTVTRTFKVTVIPVNHAPTANPLSDVTVLEDSAAQTIVVGGITSGRASESMQTVTVTAIANDANIVNVSAATSVNDGTASFTLQPVPDAVGSTVVTVVVKDDGGTANGGQDTTTLSFNVTVTLVNHAPTLDKIADQSVTNAQTKRTLKLTGITAGRTNESSQMLTLTATSSDPTIVPNPTITPGANGTASLVFEPAAGAKGTATITVTVKDDGGTANGGMDTTTQTFKINVTDAPVTPPTTGGTTGGTTGSGGETTQHGCQSAGGEMTFPLLLVAVAALWRRRSGRVAGEF